MRFFLFFRISAAAAAGPLVIATRAMFVVLGLVSLDMGAEDMSMLLRLRLAVDGGRLGDGSGLGGLD